MRAEQEMQEKFHQQQGDKKPTKAYDTPMPKVGDIIHPIHSQNRIAYWEKRQKPTGTFVRLVYDANEERHLAVCNKTYSKGIVAFLVNRPPRLGDVLKVIDVGQSACKVQSVSRFRDAISEVLKRYESQGEDDGDAIENIILDVMEQPDIIGFDIEGAGDVLVLQTLANMADGTARALKSRRKKKNNEEGQEEDV